MMVNNSGNFTHISNFRIKPPTSVLENHYGQLERSEMWTSWSAGHQQTACRRNSSLLMNPARIQSMFPCAGIAAFFQGQDPSWLLHSFPQQLCSWNSAQHFFLFFSSPTEKHVMLFNVTCQFSHHFNFFQGEAPHTEIHNATQERAKRSEWRAGNSSRACLRG